MILMGTKTCCIEKRYSLWKLTGMDTKAHQYFFLKKFFLRVRIKNVWKLSLSRSFYGTFRCSCTLYVSVNLLLYAVRVRFVALVRCTSPLTCFCTLSVYVYSFVYAVRVRLSIYSIVRSTLIFSGFVRSTLNFRRLYALKCPLYAYAYTPL